MNVSSLPRWGMALCLFGMLAASPARAEPAWTYTWSAADSSVFSKSGNSAVSLILNSGPGSGNSDILAANLEAISSVPGNSPDAFDTDYHLSLHLVDDLSGDSGDLPFSGHFGGTLSSSSVGLTHTFGQDNGKLTLGGHEYAVTLNSYSPPDLPGTGLWGALGGTVIVDGKPIAEGDPGSQTPQPPMQQAPEPSGLTLAVLGLFSLSLGQGWKSWRQRRAAVALA